MKRRIPCIISSYNSYYDTNYTSGYVKRQYSKLSLDEKRLLIFFPNRYLNKSYSDLCVAWHIKKTAAIHQMNKFVKDGLVLKKIQYIKKNGSDEFLKKFTKNYYVLTKKGRDLLNKINEERFCRPLKYLPNGRSISQGDSAKSQGISIEKKRVECLFLENGCLKQLDVAYDGVWMKLFRARSQDIVRILRFMRKKFSKGWRIRSFWGFFLEELKKVGTSLFCEGWFRKKSRECREVIDGKTAVSIEEEGFEGSDKDYHKYLEERLDKLEAEQVGRKWMEGRDSSQIVESIRLLESETGERISEKTLERSFQKSTQLVSMALNYVVKKVSGKKSTPKIEVFFEEVPVKEFVMKEEAMRDGKGNLLRDTNGKVMWEEVRVEEVRYERKRREKVIESKKEKKVKSWIGFFVHLISKYSTPEDLTESFKKKENKDDTPISNSRQSREGCQMRSL